jgi:hypothetical protein
MYSVLDGTIQTLAEAGQNRKFGLAGAMSGTPNTAFSPDGTKIAYVLRDAVNGPNSRAELWIIGMTGGAAKKIADAPASHPNLGDVVWHPSGKMIFARGSGPEGVGRGYEHWVMKHFLPVEKK